MPFQEIKALFHRERWPSDIRRPALQDFEEKRIPILQPVFDRVIDCLKKHGIAVMHGPSNRGKTFLAYATGTAMTAKDGWVTEYALATDVSFAEEIGPIQRRHGYERENFLYILDDCHKRSDDAFKFLEWALTAGDGSCRFLFLTRQVLGNDPIEPIFSELNGKGCIFDVVPTGQLLRDIARKYIESIEHLYPGSEYLSPTDAELQEFIESKVGADLDRLMRFLKQWDPGREHLRHVKEEKILVSVWNHFGLNNVHRRNVLASISALGQFDIEVHAPFVEQEFPGETVEALLNEGHLFLSNTSGGRYVRLVDSKDCEYILKLVAKDLSLDARRLSRELIQRYISSRPLNVAGVFHALFECGDKQLLRQVFQADGPMQGLQAALASRRFSPIDRVLNRLEIAAPDLTTKLLSNNELMKTYESGVRGGPAYRTRHALASLHGVESKKRFFANWSEEDYLKTIKSTPRLNTLRLLFFDLQRSGLPEVAGRFADQLGNADLENWLGSDDAVSLRELNGLVGNLRFVPERLGLFFRKLVSVDLNKVICRSEPKDVRWLLWQILLYAPEDGPVFLKRYSEALAVIVVGSDLSQGFWVLWNAFQADSQEASALLKSLSKDLQSKIGSVNTTTTLACLALLLLSGIDKSQLGFPEKQLLDTVEAINSETHVSLSVLSLKSLLAMFSRDELLEVRALIDMSTLSAKAKDFPIEKTRRFLEAIIADFGGVVGIGL